VKTLFLAWQAPDIRHWFPVGRLDADSDHAKYFFQYTQGALDAKDCGFHPMPSFPEFDKCYESGELFPMFRNRVLGSQRKDFDIYLRTLALDHNDPIEILAITGGERQTDSFEVFPKIEKQTDGSFRCRFFLHGLRYMPELSQQRAMLLQPGEELGVSIELTNPKTGVAFQLTSRNYDFVGWTPRYLVRDLLHSFTDVSMLRATVIKVNPNEVPANRRVLVEFQGHLPASVEPMTGPAFQPIVTSGTKH
jgi:hypothetical protein